LVALTPWTGAGPWAAWQRGDARRLMGRWPLCRHLLVGYRQELRLPARVAAWRLASAGRREALA